MCSRWRSGPSLTRVHCQHWGTVRAVAAGTVAGAGVDDEVAVEAPGRREECERAEDWPSRLVLPRITTCA